MLKSFLITFFKCTLRLLFRHTWLFFCPNQKKLTQSPKKDVISKNHFHHFFSKFCWGHVKSTFSNLPEFFLSKVGYFRSETENNQTITILSKKTQNVRCTHRLQLWEIWQKKQAKIPKISLNDQKLWAKFLHSKETS